MTYDYYYLDNRRYKNAINFAVTNNLKFKKDRAIEVKSMKQNKILAL